MKSFKLVIVSIAFSIVALAALSHPAKKIEASYNKETKTLTIKAIHPVNNPENHYIDEIDVIVNGNEVKKEEFKKQTNSNEQVYTLNIEVETGDSVKIETDCNKFGKKGTEIVIE